MSTVAAPGSVIIPGPRKISNLAVKLPGFAAILVVAIVFVSKYAFRYYLHYNQAAFTDPNQGAANYSVMRGWLLMHLTGGMTVLFIGPWQFWTGFRSRYARLHRWTGRLFLCGSLWARWLRSVWPSLQPAPGLHPLGRSPWRSPGSRPSGGLLRDTQGTSRRTQRVDGAGLGGHLCVCHLPVVA